MSDTTDKLGAILDKYYAPIKLPDSNRAELIRQIEDFYRYKMLEARIAENNMYIKELTRHHFPAGLKVPHIPLVQFYERIDELTTVLMRRTPKERNNE